jgi:cysteine desulfurase
VTLYFDYNATAPLRDAAWNSMVELLRQPGNPSSVHRTGRQARRLIEQARETLAGHLGVDPAGVIFTSGGTEANNLAVTGFSGDRVIASAVEHPSVLRGPVERHIPVDDQGVVNLAALAGMLGEDLRPCLVSVMLANNETGVRQPIADIAALCRDYSALLHSDGVQALGKGAIDMKALGIDLLSLSAHKIGGPQGVGALVLRDPDLKLAPLLVGGGQERRHRAGTENVAAIVGFAAAIEDLGDVEAEAYRLAALRDHLEQACLAALPDLVFLGGRAPRLPNTSCLAVPGLPAQTLLMALDLADIAVSAGSACSSGKLAPSGVLLAMGQDNFANAALRISLGWATMASEIDLFIERFCAIVHRLQAEHRAA